jgi:hypothetical protein
VRDRLGLIGGDWSVRFSSAAEKPDSPSAGGFFSCGNDGVSFDFPDQHDDKPTGCDLSSIRQMSAIVRCSVRVMAATSPRNKAGHAARSG